MVPRGPNQNITMIIGKAIPDQEVMVVDVITVILLINQNSVQHAEKSVNEATRKTFLKALQKQ